MSSSVIPAATPPEGISRAGGFQVIPVESLVSDNYPSGAFPRRSFAAGILEFLSASARVVPLVAFAFFPALAGAQSIWDGAAAPDLNWSTVTNWSDDASPAGKNLSFTSAGAAATGLTSIVSSSVSANTLFLQQNSGSVFHRLQINDGQTLTLNGSAAATGYLSNVTFLVGGVATNLANTEVSISGQTTGQGSLVVNNTGGDFVVNQTVVSGTNTAGTAVLDLSGLGAFSATVNEFMVGATPHTTAGNSIGKLTLAANTNTITSDLISVGVNSVTAATGSQLRLGQTNVFNTAKMVVGGSRGSSTLQYAGAGTATLKLRNKDGLTALPALWIGDQRNNSSTAGGSGGSSTANGLIDAGNISLDWSVSDIYLGNGASVASSNDGTGVGTLNFALGTINVTTVHLGRAVSDNTTASTQDSTSTGTINMSGGTLNVSGNFIMAENQDDTGTGVNLATAGVFNLSGGSATVALNVRMAQHTAGTPSTRAATATLNLTGGTLTVNGNITTDTEATNIDTIIVDGATLDLTNGTIGTAAAPVDTISLRSGTLKNVVEINGGGALTKSTSGVATLAGANTFTGSLNIMDGTLNVTGSLSGTSGVNVGANAKLAGTGTVTPGATGVIAVASDGEISPGLSGIGTLAINSTTSTAPNVVSLANGAKLTFDLNSGMASDQITLLSGGSGDILFAGNTVNFVDLSSGALVSGPYTLFSADIANAYGGLTLDVNGRVTSGLMIGSGLGGYSGSYLSLNGNDLLLNIIPEPTALGYLVRRFGLSGFSPAAPKCASIS